jgi:hypothetical protein
MDDLIRADTGERVQLGAQLGSTGGEGSVHQTNFPGLAAKKFTRSEGGRRKKLDWMLQNSPPDDAWTKHRFRSIAWPVALIVDRKSRRKLRGYLMPAILGGCHPTALWSAYGRRQDDRRRGFDWQYLHLAARNLSSVVDALHRNGVVIGDVKPENIFVQLNGGITIIDTDSFQVRDRGTLHPCRRVSLPYISPEAAGWKAGEPLTPEHDRFAIAILIFQVLLGGWHPFGAGHYDGANADSPSIQNLIVEGQWLFKTGTRLSPNPKTQFPIDILHPGLTALFERAFNDGHRRPDRRPSASEWRGAIDVAHNDLARCNERRNHYYSASSRDAKSRSGRPCYWCERAHTIPNGDAFAPLFDQPNRTTGARQRVRANPNARAAPLGAAAGIRRPMAAAIAGPVALPVAAHTRHLLQRLASKVPARWYPDRVGLLAGGIAGIAGVVLGEVLSQAVPTLGIVGAFPLAAAATILSLDRAKASPVLATALLGATILALIGLATSSGDAGIAFTSLGLGIISGALTLVGTTAARGGLTSRAYRMAPAVATIPFVVAAVMHTRQTSAPAHMPAAIESSSGASIASLRRTRSPTAPAIAPAITAIDSGPGVTIAPEVPNLNSTVVPTELDTTHRARDVARETARVALRDAIESTWRVEALTVNSHAAAAFLVAAQSMIRAIAAIDLYEQSNGPDTTSVRLRAGSHERLVRITEECAARNLRSEASHIKRLVCP